MGSEYWLGVFLVQEVEHIGAVPLTEESFLVNCFIDPTQAKVVWSSSFVSGESWSQKDLDSLVWVCRAGRVGRDDRGGVEPEGGGKSVWEWYGASGWYINSRNECLATCSV